MTGTITIYPFRYYGGRPYQDGQTRDGHFFEVLFRDLPAPDVKLHLGRMWDLRTCLGPVSGGEWLWCGRWALLRLAERGERGHAFFERVVELLCNVHTIAPIAEVLFWGPRGELSLAWESWSMKRQPLLAAGPLWNGLEAHCVYGRARDASLGTAARDSDFERGRAAARPVDARPARNLDDAVTRIDSFLHEYTNHAEYFADGWPLLFVLLVCANDEESGVEIYFSCDGASDAHLRSLCSRAVKALAHAYPNLGYEYCWELISD
jgi:hypothetical protein